MKIVHYEVPMTTRNRVSDLLASEMPKLIFRISEICVEDGLNEEQNVFVQAVALRHLANLIKKMLDENEFKFEEDFSFV